MSDRIRTVMEHGDTCTIVDVECHITNGLPNILIVGFAGKAIDEAKERVRAAFSNSKIQLPRKRIAINLAPADLPKEGTSFDMAIAVAIMQAGELIAPADTSKMLFLGELGLDGSIRSVRGIIGKISSAKNRGFTHFFIPQANSEQANLIPGITLTPLSNLKQLYLGLNKQSELPKIESQLKTKHLKTANYTTDFNDVVGQAKAKRALEIAAAGGHNVLMNGPPGAGKSMLAKAFPSILPKMSIEEILEATHLHSLASKNYEQLITSRPFRSPHHSASHTSVIGGGQHPRPGEISLSHHGVLFFDEFPEFARNTIEALRQPLEDKKITVARSKDTITFPANFILIATSNPCPCGHYGTAKSCSCNAYQIQKYQKKLSGPIIDRIDLYVDVDEVEHESLLREANAESSTDIQQRVIRSRAVQAKRFNSSLKTNSMMDNRDIKQIVKLSNEATDILNRAAKTLELSARSYMRTIKIAQTIADIEASEVVDTPHVTEALQYRKRELA